MRDAPTTTNRTAALLAIALGGAVFALAGARIADADADAPLRERLAEAPARGDLWLALAEQEKDPRALRLSLLTAPRDAELAPRQKALAQELGAALDPETRDLVR